MGKQSIANLFIERNAKCHSRSTAFRSIDLLHMLPSNESMIQARSVLFEQIEQRIDELDEMAAWGSQTVDDHGIPIKQTFSEHVLIESVIVTQIDQCR